MQLFIFTSDIPKLRKQDARVIEVPRELTDKDTLFSWYADALGLPQYFGSNWDAFDDCLRDLSWIKERKLVLYNRNVPLEGSPKDQKIYIDVLSSAVRDWKPGEEHEVVVAFAPSCELRLRAAKYDH